ncbi:hypothetical protein [Enterococcus sp. LJL51]|uniref:hypothetical protein n=1 Tax=Enterococcus sp. LJL51 TaxID=3416656 RepID=UPI003CF3A796
MEKKRKKKKGYIQKLSTGFTVLLLLLSVCLSCSIVFAEALNEQPTEQPVEPEGTEATESSTIESSFIEDNSEKTPESGHVEETEPTTKPVEEIPETTSESGAEQEKITIQENAEAKTPYLLRQTAGLANSVAVIQGGISQDITLEDPDFNPSLVYAKAGDTLKFTSIFTRPADVEVKSYTMTFSFNNRGNYQQRDSSNLLLRRSYPGSSDRDLVDYVSWIPKGYGAEINVYRSTGQDPIKSDILFTFELQLKSNFTGFDLMNFQTDLSVDLETLGRQQYSDSSYYWLHLKDNQPTQLSWNKDSLEEMKEIDAHDVSTTLSVAFYWSDPDKMSDYLPDGFIMEDGNGYEYIETRANDNVNSGTIIISLNAYLKKKPYGNNFLTIKAYKEDGEGRKTIISNKLLLDLTVIGSVSWMSVTDKINWTVTAGQDMSIPLARTEDLTVNVKDSRSDSDRASNPWKLSVSTIKNGSEDYPFSLVWQDTGETPINLDNTGSIVYTSGSDLTIPNPERPFAFQKNWQIDEGILLKINDAPNIGEIYEEPITVTWTLVDVSSGT